MQLASRISSHHSQCTRRQKRCNARIINRGVNTLTAGRWSVRSLEPPSWGSVVGPRRAGFGRRGLDGPFSHGVPAHVGEGVEPSAVRRRNRVEAFVKEENRGLLVLEPIVVSDLERPGAAWPQEQHPPVQLAAEVVPGRARHLDVRHLLHDTEGKDPEHVCAGLAVHVPHDHEQAASGLDEVAPRRAQVGDEAGGVVVLLPLLHAVVHASHGHVAVRGFHWPERDDVLVGRDEEEDALVEYDVLQRHAEQPPRGEPPLSAHVPEGSGGAVSDEHDGGNHVAVVERWGGDRCDADDQREHGAPRGLELRGQRDAVTRVEVVERVRVARVEREDEPAAGARTAEARAADVGREPAQAVVVAAERAVEGGRFGAGENEPRELGRQRRPHEPDRRRRVPQPQPRHRGVPVPVDAGHVDAVGAAAEEGGDADEDDVGDALPLRQRRLGRGGLLLRRGAPFFRHPPSLPRALSS
jgi:hypothetical protein